MEGVHWQGAHPQGLSLLAVRSQRRCGGARSGTAVAAWRVRVPPPSTHVHSGRPSFHCLLPAPVPCSSLDRRAGAGLANRVRGSPPAPAAPAPAAPFPHDPPSRRRTLSCRSAAPRPTSRQSAPSHERAEAARGAFPAGPLHRRPGGVQHHRGASRGRRLHWQPGRRGGGASHR